MSKLEWCSSRDSLCDCFYQQKHFKIIFLLWCFLAAIIFTVNPHQGHFWIRSYKGKQWQILFSWAPKSLWTVTAVMKLKEASPWKKSYDKPRQHIKKQRHHFANKSPYSQSYGFSSSHVWMWELDHKKGRVPKNLCFSSVALEKTLESPFDSKEIQPVNSKGNQSWIFIGR